MTQENGNDFGAHALPQLGSLYRTALYMADNETEAQELVMETFAMSYHFWPKHQIDPNCRTWLFTIMVKALMSRYRLPVDLLRVTNSDDATSEYLKHFRWLDPQLVVTTVHNLLSSISEDDVKRIIRNLPNEYRLILILSLLEGFSYQEIADIAGIDLAAVRSGLHRGRKLMHRYLFDRMPSQSISNLPENRLGGGGMSS